MCPAMMFGAPGGRPTTLPPSWVYAPFCGCGGPFCGPCVAPGAPGTPIWYSILGISLTKLMVGCGGFVRKCTADACPLRVVALCGFLARTGHCGYFRSEVADWRAVPCRVVGVVVYREAEERLVFAESWSGDSEGSRPEWVSRVVGESASASTNASASASATCNSRFHRAGQRETVV